jgi:hypothetical protein
VVNRGLQLFTWFDPASVQIKTSQVAPTIAINNAVRIQHRYNLEDEVIPQNLSIQTWPNQIVQHALHHPASTSFAWMDPRRDDDTLALLDRLCI